MTALIALAKEPPAKPNLKVIFGRIACILAPFVLWEVLPRIGVVPEKMLPRFSEVLVAGYEIFTEENIFKHIGTTVVEVGLSFVIVVPMSILVGYMIGINPYVRSILEPIVNYFVGVLKSIFLPLLILALGLGITQKVVFGVLQAVFIVTATMITGMRSVPDGLPEYTRLQRATPWQKFVHMYMPAVMPVVLEGVRLGMIFSMTGVLLAEMYASQTGLGRLVAQYGRAFDLSKLLAVALLVAVISIFINTALTALERRAGRWRAN